MNPTGSENLPIRTPEQKAKLLDLYKESAQIAENVYHIEDGLSENEIRGLQHQRRVLAKEIGSSLIKNEKRHWEELKEEQIKGETDPLTNIYNFRGFERRLNEEVARLNRANHANEEAANTEHISHSSSIILLDGDKFKQINDTLGHDEGNRILKEMAKALKDATRETDVIARIGGDEFAIILSEADNSGAQSFWDKTLSQIFLARGIKMSAGTAILDTKNIQESIIRADKALYYSKSKRADTNTNEFTVYDHETMKDINVKAK